MRRCLYCDGEYNESEGRCPHCDAPNPMAGRRGINFTPAHFKWFVVAVAIISLVAVLILPQIR